MTVLRVFSQVATVMALSLVIAADAGGGADWGRAGGGGGETETLRAAEGPRPDKKRDATALLDVAAAADDGSDDADWNRFG